MTTRRVGVRRTNDNYDDGLPFRLVKRRRGQGGGGRKSARFRHTQYTFSSGDTVTGKKINPFRIAGDAAYPELYGHYISESRYGVQPTGYVDKNGRYQVVKEMVPEFVVPDLTNFELKPYVSWKTKDVKKDALSSYELFQIVNAGQLQEIEKLSDKDLEDGIALVSLMIDPKSTTTASETPSAGRPTSSSSPDSANAPNFREKISSFGSSVLSSFVRRKS